MVSLRKELSSINKSRRYQKVHKFNIMNSLNLKIERVPYSRLTKSEMADYAEKTIGIVEKHEPDSAAFNPLFQLLSNKKSDIELLRLDYGIDKERLKAKKQKGELNLTISAFKLKVRQVSKSNSDLDMHVLTDPIKNHLRYLDKCRSDYEYNQRVAAFFDLFDKSADMQNAVSAFSLTSEVDAMLADYMLLQEIWNNRIQLLSKRRYCNTKEVVKNLGGVLDDLFDAIQVGNLVTVLSDGEPGEEGGVAVDFVSLIDELNQLSGMLRKTISLRFLINQRKRNGEPVDDLLDDEPAEQPGDGGEEGTDETPEPETEPDESGEGDGEVSGEPAA